MSRPSGMFTISSLDGGVSIDLPNPDRESAKMLVSTLVHSGRNALAQVIAQKIGRDQVKTELAWNYLTIEEWEPLLQFWNSNFFFNFEYYDRVVGARLTRECYVGDRNDQPFAIDVNGNPTAYVNCTANIIDTGRSV